ncbi:hypothetical protein ES332_A04G147300v1 [Gossypium tomentosum]|uniref:Uncharacterized protein n=1 Tax=Gossypium tomentosum TaxID=34277 RepID=A0A5D2R1H3_GOSTO|nr:hypothetical protein ES332_A04G147300v1 [Gossypium tomentosum]
MTVNSISLNRIFFIRSENVMAGTPSIVVLFTSPSSNSKPEIPVKPPKSLSFHDEVGFGSSSPSIVMSSSTKLSLNLTFLVFRSLSG